MKVPSRVFGPEDDKTLWHYTSATGFQGVNTPYLTQPVRRKSTLHLKTQWVLSH